MSANTRRVPNLARRRRKVRAHGRTRDDVASQLVRSVIVITVWLTLSPLQRRRMRVVAVAAVAAVAAAGGGNDARACAKNDVERRAGERTSGRCSWRLA